MIPLLSMIPFGDLLRGTMGKIMLGLGVAIAMFLGFKYWLHQHDQAIRDEVTMVLEIRQRKMAEDLRAVYEERLSATRAHEMETIERLVEENESLRRDYEAARRRIGSGSLGGSTDETSEVVNEALRLLRNRP